MKTIYRILAVTGLFMTHCLVGSSPAATFTSPSGVGAAFSNLQDSMALNYYMALNAPLEASGGPGFTSTLGQVRLSAAVNLPYVALANGKQISAAFNPNLASLVSTTYGGTAVAPALPNLAGRAAVGAGQGVGLTNVNRGQSFGTSTLTLSEANLPSHVHALPPFTQNPPVYTKPSGAGQPLANIQPSLGLNYYVATGTLFPTPISFTDGIPIGEVALFAGNNVPAGWTPADGRLMSVQFAAAFAIFGNRFGGDGVSTFALPDLRGRTIIGSGQSQVTGEQYTLGDKKGSETMTMNVTQMPPHVHPVTDAQGKTVTTGAAGSGSPLDNTQPSLVLNYLIGTQGSFPQYDGSGSELVQLGEIIAYAGSIIPGGYLPCDGRLLNINDNTPLFSLLGTTYGGDGNTTFALPDLRARTVVGAGAGNAIGSLPSSLSAQASSSDGECECDPVYYPGEKPGNSAPQLTIVNLPPHGHEVPEPSTLALALAGLVGGAAVVRGRRAKQ